MRKNYITIVYNTSSFVYKTRMNLIKLLQQKGYCVIVIAPRDEYTQFLIDNNIKYCEIKMSQYGINPFQEIYTTYQIW